MVEQHCEISESLWEVPPNLHAPLGSYPGMLSGGRTQTLYSLKRYPFSTSTNPYHVPISWYRVNLSLSPRSTGRSRYCLTLGGSLVVGEWRNNERVQATMSVMCVVCHSSTEEVCNPTCWPVLTFSTWWFPVSNVFSLAFS